MMCVRALEEGTVCGYCEPGTFGDVFVVMMAFGARLGNE